MNNQMFNGDRLRQVRELRGMTQGELAHRINLSQSAIAYFESGAKLPSEQTLASIALQTGFPPSFFRKPTTGDFSLGSLLFRSRSSLTATDRSIAHQYGRTAYEVAGDMMEKLKLPDVRLPRLKNTDPVTAAQITRAALGLSPDTPIPNLIHTLERAGVLILVVPVEIPNADAFSTWVGTDHTKPTIVLLGNAPGHRQRLSVAHETCHLVMHPNGIPAQMEVEAWAFAREFLVPREVMRRELKAPVTLTKLAEMKTRWGMSMNALLLYADRLHIISKRQYQTIHAHLRERGWDKNEPPNLEVPVEKPRAVRKMAELMYGKPIDYQRLATDANISAQFARQLIEAYASREEMPRRKPEEQPEESPDMGRQEPDTPTPSNVSTFPATRPRPRRDLQRK